MLAYYSTGTDACQPLFWKKSNNFNLAGTNLLFSFIFAVFDHFFSIQKTFLFCPWKISVRAWSRKIEWRSAIPRERKRGPVDGFTNQRDTGFQRLPPTPIVFGVTDMDHFHKCRDHRDRIRRKTRFFALRKFGSQTRSERFQVTARCSPFTSPKAQPTCDGNTIPAAKRKTVLQPEHFYFLKQRSCRWVRRSLAFFDSWSEW